MALASPKHRILETELRYEAAMYFSRLEAEVDDAMAAEAAALAGEADASDATTLAAAFERLAAQHAQSPLSKVALEVLAERYGSLLGELVRARAGAGHVTSS